jgi:hypothetical protein
MTTQAYLQIENNVVTNIVLWDGNTQEWQPPTDATMLVKSTTLAMVWKLNTEIPPGYVLTEEMGAGQIGFIWNGTDIVTNEPQPENPKQPTSIGTKSA